MLITIALLPLLAFATGVLAAPPARRPVIRSVPDINMVIRNPMPIDGRGAIDALLNLDLPTAIGKLTGRATVLEDALGKPVDANE
ncbi:hypothetical protein NX059_004300 [Plenodomus lindquistii]|nr:hypothetical protein NX059_004300 [Plenodomus lindquistii]